MSLGGAPRKMVVRTFDEECSFVKQLDDCSYAIEKGFVPNMRVPGHFYVNDVRDWHLQSKTCEKILFPSWSSRSRWRFRSGVRVCDSILNPELMETPQSGSCWSGRARELTEERVRAAGNQGAALRRAPAIHESRGGRLRSGGLSPGHEADRQRKS